MIELVIKIPDEIMENIKNNGCLSVIYIDEVAKAIKNGTPLEEIPNPCEVYEAKVITRGNCMMCGKELTEGLFFCKECEDKANSRK